MAWKKLFSKSSFKDVSKSIATYAHFVKYICQLQVFPTRSKGLSPLLQQNVLVDVTLPLNGEKDLETSAFDRLADTDDVLHYFTYLMLDSLRSQNLKCNLCLESKEWPELLQYAPQHN